jgi:alkanesulfonate monooxygenase SsuD/methylene tetrahydromethanopterin reductase-like flavin-dependent oxidoreductase (luciferase family)
MDEEYRGYGYPFPPPSVRIAQLDEALTVMKLLFTEPRANFEGKYYSVADAANNPKPVQKPHPPILIGGAGEKLLLRVVAQHADIWNCPNNVAEQLSHKLDVLRRHCDAVGRAADDVEVSEQCIVVLGKDEADLKQKLGFAKAMLGNVFDIDKTGLVGTPEQLIERIEARAKQGVTFFTMLFGDINAAESLELFAERVAPAFA